MTAVPASLAQALTLEERFSLGDKIKDWYKPNTTKAAELSSIFDEVESESLKTHYFETISAQADLLPWACGSISPDAEIELQELPPDLQKLHDLYENFESDNHWLSDHFRDVNLSGFMVPFEPLVREAQTLLDQQLGKTKEFLQQERFKHVSFWCRRHLAFTVFDIINRTLVLELNVSRLQEELEGNDATERFNSFIALLKTKQKRENLLKEYPVLFRLINNILTQWAEAWAEFSSRICKDWDELCDQFDIDPEAQILKIQSDKGDRHKGGRTVAIFTLSNDQKVVYKPRSLKTDIHFQDLLAFFNQGRHQLDFKTIKVLDKGTYGWMEFAEYKECHSQQEVNLFYERLGALLAVLYSINATDFHYENIVAVGDYPVPIDLESLFNSLYVQSEDNVDNSIFFELSNSVLQIALLPTRLHMGGNKVLDISGMTDMEGQKQAQLSFQAEGMDNMQIVRTEAKIEGAKNYPVVDGKKPDLLTHAKDIIKGFGDMYDSIVKHKGALLAENGPVKAFSKDEVRILLRDTRDYSQISSASTHPDVLRNGADRSVLFARIWQKAVISEFLEDALIHELSSLQREDIPMFQAFPFKKSLFSDRGDEIKDFFTLSGLDLVIAKIKGMNDEDKEKQLWFVRGALATAVPQESRISAPQLLPQGSQIEALSREDLLHEAIKIGDTLLGKAMNMEEETNWVGLILRIDRYDIKPLSIDMYAGLSGINLFFLYLYQSTSEPRFKEISDRLLEQLVRRSEKLITNKDSGNIPFGLIDGISGVIYLLCHASALAGDSRYFSSVENILAWLDTRIGKEEAFDILSGYSGVIIASALYYRLSKSEQALNLAIKLGGYLKESAQEMETGLGWTYGQPIPLTGLSHGVSGVALALLELDAIHPQGSWAETALGALQYENSHLVEKAGNWKDFREHIMKSAPPSYVNMMAWCNGAPGIGIGRARMLKLKPELSMLMSDVSTALRSTYNLGFGQNHSVCHGDFGNLETLLVGNELMRNPDLQKGISSICNGLVTSIRLNGYVCGTPLNVETPGFFTGVAGIGYQLLRLANPESIPSVLGLEGPRNFASSSQKQQSQTLISQP